ncbi:MAG TPA: ribosome silencing factor [Pyrinomonadaceae bacterium]|jgi:ribosome-associated protein|nr:ribosome silencing factor [Pyrinomonadaceae bacterium]
MKQDSTVKEQSLNPQPSVRTKAQPVPEGLDERVLATLHAASEKKAIEPVVLDLREISSFTDYFVIVSGANERQVQAISDAVYESLKKAGHAAARVEGYKTAEWILLDYGDFVVHVFEQKARKFYDLERLWRESKRVELPPEFSTDSASSLRRES